MKYPQVPWVKVIGQRNIISHDLLNGYLIELDEPLSLWNALVDKNGIEVFHI